MVKWTWLDTARGKDKCQSKIGICEAKGLCKLVDLGNWLVNVSEALSTCHKAEIISKLVI
jgi:hypothetical protein